MKIFPLVFMVGLATAVIVRSQVADVENSEDISAARATVPTAARILGEIPDGTPPPPVPPKPEFRIPAQDILEATTHEQGGRTITVQQIKPIALPPPPAPVETAAVEVDAEFTKRLPAATAIALRMVCLLGRAGAAARVIGPPVSHRQPRGEQGDAGRREQR